MAQLVIQATGRAVCQALVDGLGAWGLPTEVLTDNGVQFSGRFAKPRRTEVLFERILRDNGIIHRLTKVRSPTTTGKWSGSTRPCGGSCSSPEGPFASLEQAQKAVESWVEGYNHQRPHQALAGQPVRIWADLRSIHLSGGAPTRRRPGRCPGP